MSLPSISNVIEVITFKPNKANPTETKRKQVEALKIVTAAKGCKGISFEGVAREEPDVTVRCVEWDSVQAHEEFKQHATYKELQAALEGTYSRLLNVVHYNLFDSLESSLTKQPKCIEYVVYNLKDDVKFEDFYKEWSSGLKGVEGCPGCCPIALGQQVDNSTGVIQIQPWMTLEDHIDGFKNRSDLGKIMKPLAASVEKFVNGGWGGMKAFHLLLTAPGEAV